MPEKVKKLHDKRKSSGLKRGLFFIFSVLLVGTALWFVFKNLPGEQSGGLPVVADTKTVAVVCWETDCFSINQNGETISSIPQPGGSILFRIDDKTGREKPELGERVVPKNTLEEVMFLRKEAQNELGVFVVYATVLDKDLNDFDLHTRNGWTLRISTKTNANATLAILDRTLAELASTTIASLDYIDLRIPTRVYYKTK